MTKQKGSNIIDFSFFDARANFSLKKSSSPEKLVNLLELCIYPGIRDVSFFSGVHSVGGYWWIGRWFMKEKEMKTCFLPPKMLFDTSTFNMTHLKISDWILFPLSRKTLVV